MKRRSSRRTPCRCPNSLHVRIQRSGGLTEAEPTRGQGRSLGRIRTTRQLAVRLMRDKYTTALRQVKRDNKDGCDLMPQRRASFIPNYIRVKATTKCYCSNFRNQIRGRTKGIPGWGESLQEAQWEQMKGNAGHLLHQRPTAARGST